jgi:hypothetical protein
MASRQCGSQNQHMIERRNQEISYSCVVCTLEKYLSVSETSERRTFFFKKNISILKVKGDYSDSYQNFHIHKEAIFLKLIYNV